MDKEKLTVFKAWLREEELAENTINSYVFAVNDFFNVRSVKLYPPVYCT